MSSQWKLVPVEPTQSILDAMTTERKKGNGVLQMWFEAMAASPTPPVEAEGMDFGIDGRSVRVSQEAYSIFLAREAAGREKIAALQKRLTAADERADVLTGIFSAIPRYAIAALLSPSQLRDFDSILKPAEATRCTNCDRATVEQCDDAGCGYLGAGNGAPE